MGKIENLRVWKRSRDLTVKVYKFTCKSPFDKDYGLRDQLRRAAISVPSNIAEGDESGTNRLSVRYLYIAKGSVPEMHTQIIIANEIGYFTDPDKNDLLDECRAISAMLNNLIKIRTI